MTLYSEERRKNMRMGQFKARKRKLMEFLASKKEDPPH
jgi:hypothetical protein